MIAPSSVATAASSFASSEANPFLTLVNAAASRLENPTMTAAAAAADDFNSSQDVTMMPRQGCCPSPSASSDDDEMSTVSASNNSNNNDTIKSNTSSASATAASCSSSSNSKKKRTFAETLMWLLLNDDYSQIVTFLPDDDMSFGIINAKIFTEKVMPQVFGIRTFSSFVRKLNRWGFERIMEKKTHDVDVFRHPLFAKGDWKACAKIKCIGRLAKSLNNNNNNHYHHHDGMPTMEQQQQQQQRRLSLPQAGGIYMPQPPPSHRHHHRHHHQTIQDMTSHVVGAALDTLRRDENVQIRMILQQRQRRQREQEEKQQLHQLLTQRALAFQRYSSPLDKVAFALQQARNTVSPRSSMSFFY